MQNYSQIYIMAVFGVKYRLGLIDDKWCDQLYSVIGQELKHNQGVMPIAINGYKDHVHVFFSIDGQIAIKDIIRNVKAASSRWINKNQLTIGRFAWQDGSGKFSYSYSQIPAVIDYIRNQKEHHTVVSFRDEYAMWLKKWGHNPENFELPDELE